MMISPQGNDNGDTDFRHFFTCLVRAYAPGFDIASLALVLDSKISPRVAKLPSTVIPDGHRAFA
jgi:hypothetical protein